MRLFALSANATHGQPRTNADKRRSVELAFDEWPKLSDREIARICAVNPSLVADVRKAKVPESGTCEPTKRIGGDGKSYTVTSKKTTPAPIKDKVEDEKPHITCGLPVDQEVAPNLDIPDQEPDSEMEGSKLLPRCPLPGV